MSYRDPCSGFGFPDSSPKTTALDPGDRDQDDDFVAGLVEQMAHSMLLEDEEGDAGASTSPLPESGAAASAADCLWPPLHDLSAPLQERRSGWSSTTTSPSPAVSPPTPLHHHFHHESDSQQPQSDAWELLHMAAQEVMRLKMGAALSSSSPPSPSEIRAYARHAPSSSCSAAGGTPLYGSVNSAKNSDNKAVGSCPFGQQQLDTSWKQQQQQRSTLRHHSCYQTVATNQPPIGVIPTVWNRRARALQQQQQARQIANRNFSSGNSRSNIHHPAGSTLYSSSPQQWSVAANSSSSCGGGGGRNGSRMRAVFLRGPSFGSSTSNGTGVFLPQATASSSSSGSSREQKRKHSCSSVLLPSRIVEVLNLNVDDINCPPGHPTLGNNHVVPGSDGVVDEYLSAHLSKSYSACSPTRWHSAAEHALPTEWTY